MNEQQIDEMLSAEYSVTFSGSTLGYILSVLSDMQKRLDTEMRDNITDPMMALASAANNVVGNHVLHEIYRACGAEFLALALNTSAGSMDRLMQAKTPEDVHEAADALRKESMNKKMN